MEEQAMWAYTVWLKGRKDPIRFQLADASMLSDWEAWQTGDTTKRVGISKAPTVGAVFNFADVIGMHAQEIQRDPGPFIADPPSITQRARGLFGNRS
jgi:hypothetical protein